MGRSKIKQVTHCLNCGHTFKGNFCPNCGQKAETKRLRLSEMLINMIGPFVGGDNRFVRSCRDLIIRPGYMTRDYVLGKRIRYYHPLQLFVYLLTTYAVFSFLLGISSSIFDEVAFQDIDPEKMDLEYASIEYIIKVMGKISSNKLYGTVAAALFAVPSFRLVFKRYKIERPDGQRLSLNDTEQFYAQIYNSCISLVFSTLLLPFCLIDGFDNVLSWFFKIVTTIYVVVLYKQLTGISWWKSCLLCLLGFTLACLCFMIVIIIILIICLAAGMIDKISG